eukprot:93813_1
MECGKYDKEKKVCGLITQTLIFIISGFDSTILIGLIFADDKSTLGSIVMFCAVLSMLLACGKLIKAESFTLCCKYYCMPYSLCFCNDKQIKSADNVRSFWLSYVDASFDAINGMLLTANVDTKLQWLVVVGTLCGIGAEAIELSSHCTKSCGGDYQFFIAVFEALIGIVQATSLQFVGGDDSDTYATTSSPEGSDAGSVFTLIIIVYNVFMILAVLYAYRQTRKAKKQASKRESTARSVEMANKQTSVPVPTAQSVEMAPVRAIVVTQPTTGYTANNSNGLPRGWRIAYTQTGRMYYQNEITKQTSWTKPIA